MPARTDHDRRDAQHAARSKIAVYVARYTRRLIEEAYAHIEERNTNHDGIEEINWTEAGFLAADQAAASWGVIEPQAAIEGEAALEALPAGAI